ncbi:MAG: PEP-CTERM sorting domain-containing protein, partial [Planctomycetaceae bacterium]|nr:PEP-CTERM sorting domain-containing protein [Planctomycetaceae bacterium]
TAAVLALCAFCLFGSVPVNAGYESNLAESWDTISNYLKVIDGSLDAGGESIPFLSGTDDVNAVFAIGDLLYEFKYDDNFIYGRVTSTVPYLLNGAGYNNEIEAYNNKIAAFIMGGGQEYAAGQTLIFGQANGSQSFGTQGDVLNGGEVRYLDDGEEIEEVNAAGEDGSNSFFDGLVQSYSNLESNDTFLFAISRSLLEGSTFYFLPIVMLQQEMPGVFGLKIDEAAGTDAVPEPATLLIFGLGLTGLGLVRRYRQK